MLRRFKNWLRTLSNIADFGKNVPNQWVMDEKEKKVCLKGMDKLLENCMDIEAVPCKVPKMDWELKSEDDETNKFLEFLQAEPLSDKSPIIDKAYQKEGLTRKLVKKWIEEDTKLREKATVRIFGYGALELARRTLAEGMKDDSELTKESY